MRFTLGIVLTLSVVLFTISPLLAEDLKSNAEAMQSILYAPKPEYPYDARATHREGSGKFMARVNVETGTVTEVVVVRTTGHKILDEAAASALRRWRLKPHTVKAFYVPINFSIEGFIAEELRTARAHATFAPAPVYPLAARLHGLGGSGRYQLFIDPNSGRVTNVKILESTRTGRLDDSAAKALHQWRFVPHTVETVTVPVTF